MSAAAKVHYKPAQVRSTVREVTQAIRARRPLELERLGLAMSAPELEAEVGGVDAKSAPARPKPPGGPSRGSR